MLCMREQILDEVEERNSAACDQGTMRKLNVNIIAGSLIGHWNFNSGPRLYF